MEVLWGFIFEVFGGLGKVKKTKCSDAINVGFITDWELESRDEFTVLITTLHKNVIQFISYN